MSTPSTHVDLLLTWPTKKFMMLGLSIIILIFLFYICYQEAKKELTPEEKLAEKIRLQKIQEEEDLKRAKELFGMFIDIYQYKVEKMTVSFNISLLSVSGNASTVV